MAIDKKHEAMEASAPRKFIFVRNLPFSTTSKELEELFSDDAPIKQAFVVKDKDNHAKCRGFGYVQFVLQEDADNALKSSKTVGDRKLILCYANKKPKHEKRKKAKQEEEEENKDDEDEDRATAGKEQNETESEDNKNAETKTDEEVANKEVKKFEKKVKTTDEKTDIQRTVVLTGLTSKVKRKAFRLLCEKFGEVENIVYPVPERSEVTAFVRFKDYKSTIRAVQKLPGLKVKKSNALSAVLLTKEGKFPSKKALDKSRLIVRNLSFKVEEDELKECFSKFGKIVQVSIPIKTVNKKPVKIGCGFVQFENPANGKLALEAMNMKDIKGRTVIVDWAVKKEDYVANNAKTQESQMKKKEEEVKNNKKKQNKNEEEKEVDIPDESEEEQDNDSCVDQDSGGDDDNVSNGDDSDVEGDQGDDGSAGEEEEEEDDDDLEDMSDVDDENDSEEEEVDKEREERMKEKLKDAKEGKTIFIRNMSYNTDDDTLVEEFEKYGEVEYCRIVMDKGTGHSKGCAFIKFKEKDAADKCVKEFEQKQAENKHVVVDGRSIVVSKAVTRGKMGEIERQKAADKQETDKRNLYLALEGVITRKTPGAENLSEADLKHREKALAEKKTKLKNPQYFVSRTRLCIRNLPLSCNADELKKEFIKYSNNKEIKIIDTKIMRSSDRKDERGAQRSLGFGFIEIDNHEDALKLLRATNNNPEIFGEKRRLIVEFAVENSKALKILEAKKRKLEQMNLEKEGERENSTGGFDFTNHRVYKEKAKEKRFKRNLKYQKKREEKRKLRESKEAQNGKSQQPAKEIINSKKMNKEKKIVKKPVPKTTEKQRKRPVKEIENDDTEIPTRKRSRKVNSAQKQQEESKFESLVSKYKDKLNNPVSNKKKGNDRWFDE